jgi:hypothetical protein
MISDGVSTRDSRDEGFVLMVDGVTRSEHLVFAEAVKAGLELRRQSPHSIVKMRDAGKSPA